jgi:uncharacterized protein with von Willebrand factor type A (vWA) domain
MFATFFHELKQAGLPVTLREYLTLIEAMERDLASRRVEDFYYLSRAALVKDERNLDKFDRVFGYVFKGLDMVEPAPGGIIPAEWLKKLTEKYLTEEEKKQIEAMGGLEKLLETLRTRSPSKEVATRAARNGSAPPAPRRSARTATIPKASASARTETAISVRSRSGTSANSRISPATSSWARATSKSRCAGYANSPAPARRTSSISTARSKARRTRAISTS